VPPGPPSGGSGNGTKIALIGAAAVLVVLVIIAALLVTRPADILVIGTTTTSDLAPVATAPLTTEEVTTSTSLRRTTTTARRSAAVWTPWSPPDRSFTVEFPGLPELEAAQADGTVFRQGSTASTFGLTSFYLIGWYDLTSARYRGDSALMLNTIADGYAKDGNLQFTSRKLGTFAGNPSLDWSGIMKSAGIEFHVQGLEIVSGLRLFMFMVGDTGDGTSDFLHFRDSFHIAG
jgi:hypothetical protein